jgi:hypothetical protein
MGYGWGSASPTWCLWCQNRRRHPIIFTRVGYVVLIGLACEKSGIATGTYMVKNAPRIRPS